MYVGFIKAGIPLHFHIHVDSDYLDILEKTVFYEYCWVF